MRPRGGSEQSLGWHDDREQDGKGSASGETGRGNRMNGGVAVTMWSGAPETGEGQAYHRGMLPSEWQCV